MTTRTARFFVAWIVGTIALLGLGCSSDPPLSTEVIVVAGDVSSMPESDDPQPPAADFVDANLEAAVRLALRIPEGEISQARYDKLQALNAAGRSITDLTGIEHLRELVFLNLSQNKITDIDRLRFLLRLKNLNLQENSVSDITALGALDELEVLVLAGNRITDIAPLLQISSLQEVELTGNPLGEDAAATLEILSDLGVAVFQGAGGTTGQRIDLAFEGQVADGSTEIFGINLASGTTVNLTNLSGDEHLGGFSPDGSLLSFASSSQRSIFILELATGELREIAAGFATSPSLFSPSGDLLLIMGRRLYVVPTSGGERTALTLIESGYRGGTWSPDGSMIAALVGIGSSVFDLFVMTFPDGNEMQLTDWGRFIRHFSWSPSGTELVYELDFGLWVVTIGADSRRLPTLGATSASVPQWSPDGSLISFVGRDGNSGERQQDIFTLDVASGGVRAIARDVRITVPAKWSADGQRLAYVRVLSNDAFILHVVDRDGTNDVEVTVPFGRINNWAWNPTP